MGDAQSVVMKLSEIQDIKKRKGEGTKSPIRFYFCRSSTYPPTRITTAAPTAPATIAIVKSWLAGGVVGCSVVVVVVSDVTTSEVVVVVVVDVWAVVVGHASLRSRP